MICAKTAEPINSPFGLWSWVSKRKREFNHICQMASMCSTILCHKMCKNGWNDRFAVWVVDSGGLKKAQVESHSPGGANVPDDTLPWAMQKSICRLGCGLWWAEESTSSIVFARWIQCALIRGHIGTIWRIWLNCPSAVAMQPYVKLLWPLVYILLQHD